MSNIMVEYSFKEYIDLFIFHILPINYVTYMDQNLIFELNWVQSTIVSILNNLIIIKIYY